MPNLTIPTCLCSFRMAAEVQSSCSVGISVPEQSEHFNHPPASAGIESLLIPSTSFEPEKMNISLVQTPMVLFETARPDP